MLQIKNLIPIKHIKITTSGIIQYLQAQCSRAVRSQSKFNDITLNLFPPLADNILCHCFDSSTHSNLTIGRILNSQFYSTKNSKSSHKLCHSHTIIWGKIKLNLGQPTLQPVTRLIRSTAATLQGNLISFKRSSR